MNLILTDYSMPGMTGYELLKKIKVSYSFMILFSLKGSVSLPIKGWLLDLK